MNKLLTTTFVIFSSINVLASNNLEPITVYENSIENAIQEIRSNFQSRGPISFATVGNGVECTHTNIQAAIDSGADEVRIVHDHTYQENLTIVADYDLMITGSYNNCINANNDVRDVSGVQPIIEGVSGSVVTIVAPPARASRGEELPRITLRFLEIRNGTGTFGGGVLMLPNVVADISILYSNIHNNTSILGGGISILGEGEIGIVVSRIHDNSAVYGGGIFCSSSLALIRGLSASITSNLAFEDSNMEGGQGGGIFASNGCVVSLSSHLNRSGVSLNQAEGQGGGIYAKSGAKIYFRPVFYCSGQCIKGAMKLTGNESDSDHSGNENGGGAFITGANTLLSIYDGYISDNKSGGHGGAISIENGAKLSTRKSKHCWNNDHCVYFSNNKAGEQSFGAGGAIFNSSSIAEIGHAVFEGNRADFGTVLYGSGLNSLTTFNGSIINNNGEGGGNSGANGYSDNYVLRVVSDAVLHVHNSTIADNNVTLSVLGISISTTANSTIFTSIINDADSGNVFSSSSSGYFTDCNLAHEIGSFISPETSSAGAPSFVDRVNRDYHILPTSLAVDGCDNINHASDILDIDLQPRGYDDPNHANTLGAFDIGADETYTSDIIFKHGFE